MTICAKNPAPLNCSRLEWAQGYVTPTTPWKSKRLTLVEEVPKWDWWVRGRDLSTVWVRLHLPKLI